MQVQIYLAATHHLKKILYTANTTILWIKNAGTTHLDETSSINISKGNLVRKSSDKNPASKITQFIVAKKSIWSSVKNQIIPAYISISAHVFFPKIKYARVEKIKTKIIFCIIWSTSQNGPLIINSLKKVNIHIENMYFSNL